VFLTNNALWNARAAPKLDLCGTRVASKHRMVISVLHIKDALYLYTANRANGFRDLMLSDTEWQQAAEFEACFAICAVVRFTSNKHLIIWEVHFLIIWTGSLAAHNNWAVREAVQRRLQVLLQRCGV
jgi:hypothetical protein